MAAHDSSRCLLGIWYQARAHWKREGSEEGGVAIGSDLYQEHTLRELGEYNANGVTYQVQHWPNGQWDREHNWRKVEAASEKEAAEKVCGFALAEMGMLAQLRARVLRFGDLKQRRATEFYKIGSTSTCLHI